MKFQCAHWRKKRRRKTWRWTKYSCNDSRFSTTPRFSSDYIQTICDVFLELCNFATFKYTGHVTTQCSGKPTENIVVTLLTRAPYTLLWLARLEPHRSWPINFLAFPNTLRLKYIKLMVCTGNRRPCVNVHGLLVAMGL